MKDISLELHKLFNRKKRFAFPFDQVGHEIPYNGIYIMFEAGEKYTRLDRIVRVGTHTGNNQLHSRLKQHFVKENKNRSIFRKNIGRCILTKTKSSYLPLWELDSTSREDKAKNLKFLDLKFEVKIEKQISAYIQKNLSFCVFKVETKEERLFWESKIVSTLAKSTDLKPSTNWLGNYSPKEKIKASGLWQVNELYKTTLSKDDCKKLKILISSE
jgi:hypothetical protein